MTSRDRIVLVVVAVAAAVGAFWFLALAPKREDAKKLQDQVSAQQTRLSAAQSSLSLSRAARAAYKANYSTVARLGKAVPADDDVPSLVYQLARTADGAGVDFRSIKVSGGGSSSSPTPPSPNAPKPGGSSAGGSGTAAGGGSTATQTPAASQPASPTQGASAGLPPGSSVGPAGFPTMPFSFEFDGSFFQLANFFNRLERYVVASPTGSVDVTGRLLQIDGISLNAAARGFPHMTASVAVTAYLLPATQGATNGATPGSPASSGSAQPARSQPTTSPAPPATATGPIK